MIAYTDYPLYPNERGKLARVRTVKVISYDGDKYVTITHDGESFEIKAGYLYSKPGRLGEVPVIDLSNLERIMAHSIKVGKKTFRIEIDPTENMDAVNNVMVSIQDAWVREIEQIAKHLSVSDQVASDIWYLRTRSRHTPELEQQLIDACHSGRPIDSIKVCNGEWPE